MRTYAVKRLWRLLARIRNGVRAFRSAEFGYHLGIGQFGAFQVAYRRGTADEMVIQHSFDKDIYLSGVPEYRPEPNHVIIDVGAHIGTFALLAAAKVPAGRVYAIEACEETYNYLRINVALNRLQNVEASHLALSHEKGRTVLHYGKGNWGHSITKRLSAYGEEVATDTLAGYMEGAGIKRCDFIRFNCEGAEFPILLNTPAEVLGRIGKMLILYHCELAEQYDVGMLIHYLQQNAFRTTIRNQTEQKGERRGWIIAERVSVSA